MKTKYWDFPKNNLAIEIKNLNKAYNDETQNLALDDVSLEIPAGSFFGLLGPNGAGKSTLINIVSGVVIKTSGDVSIWGYDIDKHRKQSKLAIGVVPQELNIDAFSHLMKCLIYTLVCLVFQNHHGLAVTYWS